MIKKIVYKIMFVITFVLMMPFFVIWFLSNVGVRFFGGFTSVFAYPELNRKFKDEMIGSFEAELW